MNTARENTPARRRGPRPRLFISYRRRTDSASARLLKDELTRAFGEGAAFRDVDDIEAGETFPETIREALEDCDVFLLLVSPGWVESVPSLRDPDDFVRREVAAALARRVPLIPVLLGDARMPKADELPEEIRDLAFRQAIELSDDRWDYDVARLFKFVRARAAPPEPATFFGRAAAASRRLLKTWPGRVTVAAAGVAAVVLAFYAAAGLAIWYEHFGRDFEGCVLLYTPDVLGGAANIRSGAQDSPVVSADGYDVVRRRRDEPDGIPFMLRLSDSGREIGVVFFRFFKAAGDGGGEFRVERIIEPRPADVRKCADVEKYFNANRPAADKRVLKNWDRLGLHLGGRDYLLRLGDHGDYMVATLLPAPDDMPLPWKK